MRRYLVALSAALLAVVVAAPQASAAPIFLSASASTPSDTGTLQVDFKIGGVLVGTTITVKTTATVTAVYACQNNGGNFPSDPKKTQTVKSVAISGKFKADLLGQVVGSLMLKTPASTLRCPRGQHVVLVSTSYDKVTVATGTTTTAVTGTFARVFLDI